MGELNFGRLLRRCEIYGDDPAILDLGNGHLSTYAESLERIEKLCAVIAQLGVGPQDRVGVLAGDSHVYIELWRAALAGAAVINPINARLSAVELVHILNDSGTEVIFVDAATAGVIDQIRDQVPIRTVVLIEDAPPDASYDVRLDELMANTDAAGLPDEPDDDAPCVLMYTGGTTGLPKGVLLTQAAVMLLIYRLQIGTRLGSSAGQRYLAFMPMFHIGGVGAWGALLPHGALIVVLRAFEPGAVLAAMRDHNINITTCVPTMIDFLTRHPDYSPESFASLEAIYYGAAPMPPELIRTVLAEHPDLAFIQGYGMTECPMVTGLYAEDHRRGDALLESVGRPMPGCLIDIRDPETAEPVEAGEVGEIYVSSGSMMQRYWNNPEATDEVIVDGWYRTGDAGRFDADGYLYLADRVKDMIISGGENVYSLEVENVISAHPAVQMAAVIGRPDPTWGEAVHAFVVCADGSVTEAELEAHARESLAGYKIPRSWTLQSEPLPLSGAGKVLKRDLRTLVAASSSGDS